MPDARQILESSRFFSQFSEERMTKIAGISTLHRMRKGQVLLNQGGEVPGIFVVGTGRIKVYRSSSRGKEHVLHLAGPGETFAEIAVLEGMRAPATAEVLETGTYVLIQGEEFMGLMDTDPLIAREMIGGLTSWVRRLVDLLEDLVLRDGLGRVASHLLYAPENADGLITIAHKKNLASHLDLTPESLSRILSRLEEEDIIRMQARSIQIRDRKTLGKLAN